ncbi:MAG: hypothetical protein IPP29_16755 [Bacteroidetes bacterium]|nr:hypothetical protein [Bacteroidota bacterium]
METGLNDTTQYPIQLSSNKYFTSDTFTVTVSVYSLPHANFGANFTDTCSPALVQFNNISIGNTFSYSWYVNGLFYSDSILLIIWLLTLPTLYIKLCLLLKTFVVRIAS